MAARLIEYMKNYVHYGNPASLWRHFLAFCCGGVPTGKGPCALFYVFFVLMATRLIEYMHIYMYDDNPSYGKYVNLRALWQPAL